MAIAVRSFSSSITISNTTGLNSLVTASPSGKTVGDLLVLTVTNRGNNAIGIPTITTGSSGWTASGVFSSASIIGSTTSLATKWWYRTADGTANDTPTVTGSFTNGNDGNLSYNLIAITGANNSNPGDVAGAASATTATITAIPAITTTAAGDLQIGVWNTYSSAGAAAPVFTTPSGWTPTGSATLGSGNTTGGHAAFYRIISSASSLSAASVTKTNPGTQQTMTTVAIFAAVTSPVVSTAKIGWGIPIR